MSEPGDIAIGIDLGTSYSCVSIIENGQTAVIPNEWGERTHASVVSFLEDGTVLVGNSAKRNIITNADNTVYSAKRLIGRFYFSDEVKKAQAVMPYKIIEGENNSVRIQIRENVYSLPEISALVLKEMKAIAEQYLGRLHLTLGQTAYLLGFADQASFFRACKRWFDQSPGQYRRRLERLAT